MKDGNLHSVRGWHRFVTCVRRTGCKPVPRGFTLVEMLVVISIIAILLTIVVGVTHIVLARASTEQTRSNMQIIIHAIEEYRLVKDEYPPDETDFTGKPDEWTGRDWEAYCRGRKLYNELVSIPQVHAHLSGLKKDATKNIEGNNVFMDGFEKYMEYFRDKGVGGSPVIVSAGVDGKFDTEKDLRSDNQ